MQNEVLYMIIAVCDDDKIITSHISYLIRAKFLSIVETRCFNSLEGFKTSVLNKEIPDAIIMDICVNNGNGILMLREMRELIPKIPVVFITGYTEYSQDIFIDFVPFGLLTKPIDSDKLYYYINKIIDYYKINRSSFVKLSVNGQNILIDKNEILYLESHERKVTYHTVSDKFEEYIKLDNAMQKIDDNFLRCHKSYAVNLKYATDFSKSKITLSSGDQIPISRSQYDKVKKVFFEHMASKIGL